MKKILMLGLIMLLVIGCGGNDNNNNNDGGGNADNGTVSTGGSKLYCTIAHNKDMDQDVELTYVGDKAVYVITNVKMTVPKDVSKITKDILEGILKKHFASIDGIEAEVTLQDKTLITVVLTVDAENLDYDAFSKLAGAIDGSPISKEGLQESIERDRTSYKAYLEGNGWTCQ